MKILITGKSGQLGFELQSSLATLGEVIAFDSTELDLTDPNAIRACIRSIRPDVIVNPAAYTAVDKAESDEERAFAVNACAPAILGEEAAGIGALVIHYSTDYVFDGEKATAYIENDDVRPQSTYGRSKLAGEHALAKATSRHLILRTSWVVGPHGGNFAKTMLRLARERDKLSVVADQFGAPTSAILLANLTAHLIWQYAREGGSCFPFGLYHVTASGETNWHEYAQFVLAEAAAAGCTLRVSANEIEAISAAAYPTPAKRPSNSRLDTTRFRDAFGLTLPDWRAGVRQVLHRIL